MSITSLCASVVITATAWAAQAQKSAAAHHQRSDHLTPQPHHPAPQALPPSPHLPNHPTTQPPCYSSSNSLAKTEKTPPHPPRS